mgnify:CR=1 FL=1
MKKLIYNHTEENLKRTFAWSSSWYHPYESAWSIFHKFMFANKVTINDLFKIFGSESIQNKRSNVWSKKDGDLFTLEGFDEKRLQDILGFNLKANIIEESATILKILFQKHQYKVFYIDTFRFCPECIKIGYHSTFHQFKLFNTCPLHNKPLSSICPSCGGGWKNEYNLIKNEIKHPFQCQCGFLFINEDMARMFAKTWSSNSHDIRDSSLVTRLFELNAHSEKTKRIHISDCIDLTNYENPFEYLYLTVNSKEENTKHIVYKSSKNINKIKCLDKKLLSKYIFTPRHKRPNKELYFTLKATYKSIARHFRKTILKDHKKCIKSYNRSFTHSESICPFVSAYAHWRGHIEDHEINWHVHTYRKRKIAENQVDFYTRSDSDYFFNIYIELMTGLYNEKDETIYGNEPSILHYVSPDNLTITKYTFNRLFAHLLHNYLLNWLIVAHNDMGKSVHYFYSRPFMKYKNLPFYTIVYPFKDNEAAEFHIWPNKDKTIENILKKLKCPNNS